MGCVIGRVVVGVKPRNCVVLFCRVTVEKKQGESWPRGVARALIMVIN